jgi:hypothetical protein
MNPRPSLLLGTLVVLHALLAGASDAAPAPLPRREPALERDPLFRDADRLWRAALALRDDAARREDDLSPSQYVTLRRQASAMARDAAERFERLCSRYRNDHLSLLAGEAWLFGGQRDRALPHFEAVLVRSADAATRELAQDGARRSAARRILNRRPPPK